MEEIDNRTVYLLPMCEFLLRTTETRKLNPTRKITVQMATYGYLIAVSVGAADIVIGFKVSDSPSLTSLPATAAACWLVGGAMLALSY